MSPVHPNLKQPREGYLVYKLTAGERGGALRRVCQKFRLSSAKALTSAVLGGERKGFFLKYDFFFLLGSLRHSVYLAYRHCGPHHTSGARTSKRPRAEDGRANKYTQHSVRNTTTMSSPQRGMRVLQHSIASGLLGPVACVYVRTDLVVL